MQHEGAFIIRRIPLAQLYRNHLVLGLTCPCCGYAYHVDYYASDFKAREGNCLACGALLHLRPKDLRAVLERSFRRAAKRIEKANRQTLTDAFTKTILNAASLLEPILKVVIVRLRVERLGHYILNTSSFLWRLEDENCAEALIFAEVPNQEYECNRYLGKKWGERFIITPAVNRLFPPFPFKSKKKLKGLARLAKNCRRLLARFYVKKQKAAPPSNKYVVSLYESSLYENVFDLVPGEHVFPIAFTQEEESRAQKRLTELGIPPGTPYVCFLGRDSVYMEKAIPSGRWSYHDYRNMDINSYLPAMRWLAERGVTCLRMGSAVQKPLAASQRGIVDYAVSGRDEFMDIYLFCNCWFAVSCGSGPDILPVYRGRQVLLCNYTLFPVRQPSFRMPNLNIIYKKFRLQEENRLLSCREIFERHLDSLGASDEFREHGIELIDNTPEEILAGVQETYAKAAGSWVMSDEEKRLQAQYRQILANADPEYASMVGASPSCVYLKMNPYLLE